MVDLGAGTGQFTLAVAAHCARVVAADISPVMLQRLRAKVTASAETNVQVVDSGFLTYQHQGPLAHFVYSRWALHHLPDFWKALALHKMRSCGSSSRMNTGPSSFRYAALLPLGAQPDNTERREGQLG